jgi:ATP-dependent DNA helicase RecG
LADAVKRIGLAERTGRGIDRIYEGMLRYGRPAPDYAMSTSHVVNVFLSNAVADRDFLKMVVEQERRNGPMPVDSLIILSRLRGERRLTTADLAPSLQKPESGVRAALEKLVEAGFLEPHGAGRGRTYTLGVTHYQKEGKKSEYVRQAGFASIQQEQMILSFIDKHKSAKRADIMDLCRISGPQAYRMLKLLINKGIIKKSGDKKGAVYTR